MKKVIVILGQTASGKSNLAVEIAKKFNGEIISADSRQVYKGLDIGTGKITKKEMRGIPHHLLDIANPKRKFTVAQYKTRASAVLDGILRRGKIPIICGGTGFYIDAITKGLVFPEVPPNKKLRLSLEKRTAGELFKILKKIDTRRARNIDPNNKVRLIRSIEIANALGKVPRARAVLPRYNFTKIGLVVPLDKLKMNIEKRVKKMFKDGLLKEVAKLKANGVSDKRLKELGFEYFNPTPQKVISETLKYAKRQMTWFKRDKKIKWYDSAQKAINALKMD